MKTKICNIIIRSIFMLYALMGISIICIDIFSNIEYTYKKEFLISNGLMICIGVILVVFIIVIYQKYAYILNKIKVNINVLTVILFMIQVYICFNIYFVTNHWDPAMILWNAKAISQNLSAEWLNSFYFSCFPNNQFIVYLYALIFKLNNMFGIFDTENGLLFIIIIQCVLSSLTGRILYDVICDYTDKSFYGLLGWISYVILIGLSGWNVITYTDAIGLIFPILILRVYQLAQNGKKVLLKWFFIITLSYWGFKSKPTALIVTIAIIIVELIDCMKNMDKEKVKKIGKVGIMCFVCLVVYSNIFSKMIQSTNLAIDPEADTGPLHMIMMGLNPVNHGAWYGPDVELSQGIADKDERTAAQIAVIKQRLSDYGIRGGLEHLWGKALIIFNDGTFAWGSEGGFYDVVYEDKNTVAAPFLKNLYYNDGENYMILSTIEHFFWINILGLSVWIVLAQREKKVTVVALSLIGIILFNLLFEARARYLMLYVPFWIAAAMISLKEIPRVIFKIKISSVVHK